MFVVMKSQVELSDNRRGMVAEASSLSLPPGVWPSLIAVVDAPRDVLTDTIVGGFLFLRGAPIVSQGEFGGYRYATKDGGTTLIVYND